MITELNELVYAGAKLVSKPGWEIRLETQTRKLRKKQK